MTTSTLQITGMHCTSCKSLIEEVCQETSGVTSCTVDYETGKAVVEHDSSFDLDAVIKEITSLGEYKVEKV